MLNPETVTIKIPVIPHEPYAQVYCGSLEFELIKSPFEELENQNPFEDEVLKRFMSIDGNPNKTEFEKGSQIHL